MPTTEIYQIATISILVVGFLISFIVRTNQNAELKSHMDEGIARVEKSQALHKQESEQMAERLDNHIADTHEARKTLMARNDKDHGYFHGKINEHDKEIAVIHQKLKGA